MSARADRLKTAVLTLLLCWGLTAHAYEFAGGTGEPNDPYQIATAEQFISIGSDQNLLDKHFVLLNDIDLDPNLPGGRVFTRAVIPPFPGDWAVFRSGIPFTGSLDGRGHKIRNLMIRANDGIDLGLFGRIGKRGAVRDLGIADADVGGGFWGCGALAGTNEGGISRCYAQARVSGASCVGILVGSQWGDVVDSYCEGRVLAGENSTAVGGLAGSGGSGIRASFWDTEASGLAESSGGTGLATAQVTSKVPGQGHVNVTGGLVGDNNDDSFLYPPGQVSDSYFLIDTDGGGPDNAFGVPLTDAQMRSQSSFISWDFEDVWTICGGRDYPRLRWEGVQCEP